MNELGASDGWKAAGGKENPVLIQQFNLDAQYYASRAFHPEEDIKRNQEQEEDRNREQEEDRNREQEEDRNQEQLEKLQEMLEKRQPRYRPSLSG